MHARPVHLWSAWAKHAVLMRASITAPATCNHFE